jgi:hypothetical protein
MDNQPQLPAPVVHAFISTMFAQMIQEMNEPLECKIFVWKQ